MKQNIDLEQINSLSPKAKEKLVEWMRTKGYEKYEISEHGPEQEVRMVLPNIGQMIEYLSDHTNDFGVEFSHLNAMWVAWWGDRQPYTYDEDISDLCDVLWEAVKEILERND